MFGCDKVVVSVIRMFIIFNGSVSYSCWQEMCCFSLKLMANVGKIYILVFVFDYVVA